MKIGLQRKLAVLLNIMGIVLTAQCAPTTTPTPTPAEAVAVWTGQNLFLSCEDIKELGSYRRLWYRGTDLLTAATVVITFDERVRVVNDVNIEISNITIDDEGEYTCTIVARIPLQKKFDVTIKEVTCQDPDDVSSSIVEPAKGTMFEFKFGDHVHYSCMPGYTLLGAEIRTCSVPNDNGWDGEPPTCELEVVASVSRRMSTLENKLAKLLNVDMETLLKVEEKFTALEQRVQELESDTGLVRVGHTRTNTMDREVHYLKKVLNLNALRESWEEFLNVPVARLGVRDGHVVSEYSWVVNNIESLMVQYKGQPFDYVESPSFYTHIPGYRVILHLFPNYDDSDHIGLYAILLRGRFDDVIAWPFTSKYVMSVGTLNEGESDVYDTIVPARLQSCKFDRPPPDNTIGCGFGAFLSHETLRAHGHLHKLNGSLLVRISIFLDD